MTHIEKMELLAPAGSFECLTAAIQAGADSVYFGVEQLNMRTRASHNFLLHDLEKIMSICRSNHIKAYLTLNTIIYDHDMALMKRIVDEAMKHQVHAIIASDHAVLHYAKKIGQPVHISTQCNITNIDTVEFYAEYADVMVMARELSLMQVAAIHKEIIRRNITGPSGNLVKIEVFGHGALCMAISGKCYLSLHTHNASANRGACIQNCRHKYIVSDKEDGTEFEIDNEYIMSAKDLCTIGFLDKIRQAGVSVLKIEGRGRNADYVYTSTQCYREAIEACEQNIYSQEKIENWMTRLSTVFNRGFWDGYYLGRTMGEWNDVYGSKATKRNVFVGIGVNYFEKNKAGVFQIESHSLSVGDDILITGPTTGVVKTTIKEMRNDFGQIQKAERGEVISIALDTKMRASDKLYKVIEAE